METISSTRRLISSSDEEVDDEEVGEEADVDRPEEDRFEDGFDDGRFGGVTRSPYGIGRALVRGAFRGDAT